MKLKHRTVPFDIKAVSDQGSFEGYLSVFGTVDAYNDVVMPGAFTRTIAEWKAKDAMPPVLWQHMSSQPIGPFTSLAQDSTGLAVKGNLLVADVQQAREAHALLKAKVIRGLSIGYDVFEDGYQYDASHNILQLTSLDLWEGSIATFPANIDAMVTEVKHMFGRESLPTLRQFEGLLRDAGCTRKQAADIARGGLIPLLTRDAGESGSTDDGSLVDSALQAIENYLPTA